MTDRQIKDIADNADMIIGGYAFTLCKDGFIHVLNINSPCDAMVISKQGELLETNMDDIEQAVVLDYYHRNAQFLEDDYEKYNIKDYSNSIISNK